MAVAFNSDILLGVADQETARLALPNIYFALDHKELRDLFVVHDARANKAKTRSRRWGAAAVLLATFALIVAASSSLYSDLPKPMIQTIGVIGAIAGATGISIGAFGLMYRGRKLRWLTDRLATERMRQFHFQHYAAHAREILAGAGDAEAARAYLAKRTRDFETFKAGVISRVEDEFHALAESEDPGDGLMFASSGAPPADHPHLDEYLRAYEMLRITRQIDYCNLLLSERRSLWKHSPARQAKVFGTLAFTCVAVILGLDAIVFAGAITHIEWMSGQIIQVAGIWAAFLALSIRTLEEGLQPKVEVERMRYYRLSLNRHYASFKNAQTPEDRVAAMFEVEKSAFEEMLPFLKSHFEAKFVM